MFSCCEGHKNAGEELCQKFVENQRWILLADNHCICLQQHMSGLQGLEVDTGGGNDYFVQPSYFTTFFNT